MAIGLVAALGATAAFAASTSLGTFSDSSTQGEGDLHMVADPAGGAWAWYLGASGE